MKRLCCISIILFFTCVFVWCSNSEKPSHNAASQRTPYPDEVHAKIGRGLIAIPNESYEMFLSWRLLPNDEIGTAFQIYKCMGETTDVKKLRKIAQTDLTFYTDRNVEEDKKYTYAIKPIRHGKNGEFSSLILSINSKAEKNRISFDLGRPFQQARIVTGDLTGDGELEIVIAYSENRLIDPFEDAWQKSDATIKVTAFLRSGDPLWNIDLGWGIEAGPAYSPIIVWDMDSDGRAEVILKTNATGDPLDYSNDRLTIVDGLTGEIKKEAKWPRTIGNDYNSNSRNYLAVAHLDGKNPYIIAGRGLYHTQVIQAYDSDLNQKWERVLGLDLYWPEGVVNKLKKYLEYDNTLERIFAHLTKKTVEMDTTRASHSLPVADIDDDGKEEILWGEHCIGEGGEDLWTIEEKMPYDGHPDIVFAADIISSIPGKEIFYCREGWKKKRNNVGMLLVDNKGKPIWARWGYTHIDGGWVAKIMPDQEDMQCFGYDIAKKQWSTKGAELKSITGYLWDAEGQMISNPPESWVSSIPIDWDGDGIREICSEHGDIMMHDGTVIGKADSRVLWGADLFGDHREEIVLAPPGSRKVYIVFNTTDIRNQPSVTKLADRQYRNDLSRTAMQANVIPTESHFVPRSFYNENF